MQRTPRRISSRRRRKQIDIVCSRGRRSRPPALPFLARSNSGRAALAMPAPWAAPILDGPPRRVPWVRRSCRTAWTVAALPGLAMPSGGLRSIFPDRWSWSASAWAAGPSAAAPGQPAPDHLTRGRGRLRRGRLRRGQLPPRISPPAPAIFPQVSGREFPP